MKVKKLRWLLAPLVSALCSGAAVASCGARSELDSGEAPAARDAGPVVKDSGPEVVDDGPDVADALPDVPDVPDVTPPIDAEPEDSGPLCTGALTAYLWGADSQLYTFDPATLQTKPLGVVICPTPATPWTLSVSKTGIGYFIFQDWNIYQVNLSTLACATTPYVPGQLGFTGEEAIAVSRGGGVERLYVYGVNPVPTLAVSDLTSFVLSPVGAVTPDPLAFPIDMQGDAFGRLSVLAEDGTYFAVSAATAASSDQHATGFDTAGGAWAVLTYGTDVYFFGSDEGNVSHYDPQAQQLTNLGTLGIAVVGASAAPCVP